MKGGRKRKGRREREKGVGEIVGWREREEKERRKVGGDSRCRFLSLYIIQSSQEIIVIPHKEMLKIQKIIINVW